MTYQINPIPTLPCSSRAQARVHRERAACHGAHLPLSREALAAAQTYEYAIVIHLSRQFSAAQDLI